MLCSCVFEFVLASLFYRSNWFSWVCVCVCVCVFTGGWAWVGGAWISQPQRPANVAKSFIPTDNGYGKHFNSKPKFNPRKILYVTKQKVAFAVFLISLLCFTNQSSKLIPFYWYFQSSLLAFIVAVIVFSCYIVVQICILDVVLLCYTSFVMLPVYFSRNVPELISSLSTSPSRRFHCETLHLSFLLKIPHLFPESGLTVLSANDNILRWKSVLTHLQVASDHWTLTPRRVSKSLLPSVIRSVLFFWLTVS